MATQVLGQSASSCFLAGNSDLGMAATTNMYDLSRAELAAPQLFMLADVALTGETGGSSSWDYQVGEERQMAELSTVHDASSSDGEGDGMACLPRIEIDSQGIERIYMDVTQNHSEEPNKVFTIPTVETLYTPRITEEKNKYSKSKPFRCKPCQFVAGTEEEFVDHIKVHSAKKFIVEEDAEKQAQLKESEVSTSTSEESDLLKGPIRCERCGYNTSRYDHYVAHLKHHEQVGNNERVYSCPICTYTTVSEYHWKKHLRNHFPRKVYTCHECSYFSDRKNNYIQHIRTHTGERPYQCFVCSYQSSQKTHLTRHMRIHSGEKPFKCDLCNYVASNQHEVTRHVRQVHNGPKPLVCPHCEYKTADRSNYKKHVELHVSPRQFICPVCQYAASKKCNLQYHIKSRHYNCSYINIDVSKVRLRTKKNDSGDLGSTFNKKDDHVQLEILAIAIEKQPDETKHQEDKENCLKADEEDSNSCVNEVKTKKRKSAIKSKDYVEKANPKRKDKPVKPCLDKRRAETGTVAAKGDEESLKAESDFMNRDKQLPESVSTEKEVQATESVPSKVDEKKSESVSTKTDKKKMVTVSEKDTQTDETISRKAFMKKTESRSTEGNNLKSDNLSAKGGEPNGEEVIAKGDPNRGSAVYGKVGMQKGESVSAKEDQQKGKTVSVKMNTQNGEVNTKGEKQKGKRQKMEAGSAKGGMQRGKKQNSVCTPSKLDKQKQMGEGDKAEGGKQKGEETKTEAVSAKENKQNDEAISAMGDKQNGGVVNVEEEKGTTQKTEAVPTKGEKQKDKKQKVESGCTKRDKKNGEAVSVTPEKHNGEAVIGEGEKQKGEQQKAEARSPKANKPNVKAVCLMGKKQKADQQKCETVSTKGEKQKGKKQNADPGSEKATKKSCEAGPNGKAVNEEVHKQKDKSVSAKEDEQIHKANSVNGVKQKGCTISAKLEKQKSNAVSAKVENQKPLDLSTKRVNQIAEATCRTEQHEQKAGCPSPSASTKEDEGTALANRQLQPLSLNGDEQNVEAVSMRGEKQKAEAICAFSEKDETIATALVQKRKLEDKSENAQTIKKNKKEAIIATETVPCLKKSERIMKKKELLKRANQLSDGKLIKDTAVLQSSVKNKEQTRASKACSRLLKDSELTEVTLLLGSNCTLVDHTDKNNECHIQDLSLKKAKNTVTGLPHLNENKDAASEQMVETCSKDDDTNHSKGVSSCAAAYEHSQEQPLSFLTKEVEVTRLLNVPEAGQSPSNKPQIKDQTQVHAMQKSIETKRCAEKQNENTARILVQHREEFVVHAEEMLDNADRTAEQQRETRKVGAKHKKSSAETHAGKRRHVTERAVSKLLENRREHGELPNYGLDLTTEVQKQNSAFKIEHKKVVSEVDGPSQKNASDTRAELQMDVSEMQVRLQKKASETSKEPGKESCAEHADMQNNLEMDLNDKPLLTEQPKNKPEIHVQQPKDIEMPAVQQKDTGIFKLQKKGALMHTHCPMAKEVSCETQNDLAKCVGSKVDESTLARDLVRDQAKGVARVAQSSPGKPGQDPSKNIAFPSTSTSGRTSVTEIDEDEGIHSHDGSDISDNISEGSDDSGLNSASSIPELKESKSVAHSAAEKEVTSQHFVCIFCDRSFKIEGEYSKHLNRHLVNVYYIEKAAGGTSKQ